MDIFLKEQGVFRWGRFVLDPQRRSLTCDGVRTKLAERLFDVLFYLVTNQGRVVARDELLQAVWVGRTVEDNNVSQAIFELRRALATGGNADRSIVTVPGRGFRFAEPVLFEPVAAGGSLADPPRLASVPWWRGHLALGVAVLALVLAGFSLAFWASRAPSSEQVAEKVFAPPAHSVAVLAFENMTGDPSQSYFSDGLAEQLIDGLTRIDAMQVAGRTSSFSFRGGHAAIGEIARALNVGAVLAGSVRRSGNRLVVTASLTNAISGFNMWSRTYDRDLGDIVGIETDIAQAATQALQVRLLGGEADKLTLGGTTNSAAYDLYLRGRRLERSAPNEAGHRAALAAYDQALAIDPGFARAHVGRSSVLSKIAMQGAVGSSEAQHRLFQDALAAADRAVALAPGLGQAHSARAWVLNFGLLEHQAAEREMAQAQLLSPGNAGIEGNTANIELAVGHVELAVTAARRGSQIDPLSIHGWGQLGRTLFMARRYGEAAQALHHAAALTDNNLPPGYVGLLGVVLVLQGDAGAARTLCAPGANLEEKACLAIADQKVGRQAEADATLASLRKDQGDADALGYAEIYAQWGRHDEALGWLETAARLHDPGMGELGIDPLLDPIRGEERFKQVQVQLAASAQR